MGLTKAALIIKLKAKHWFLVIRNIADSNMTIKENLSERKTVVRKCGTTLPSIWTARSFLVIIIRVVNSPLVTSFLPTDKGFGMFGSERISGSSGLGFSKTGVPVFDAGIGL